jgi:hypothetical protein
MGRMMVQHLVRRVTRTVWNESLLEMEKGRRGTATAFSMET